jgi:histone acetyltransferase HTATIP
MYVYVYRYYSPYPEGYHNIECLFLCEFCLSFYITKNELNRHVEKCPLTHPPGGEIYRHKKMSVFEVDDRKNPTYCENLCYLAKLFLDHKTLFFNVEPFLFFIECETDKFGHDMVGYFSKEKES